MSGKWNALATLSPEKRPGTNRGWAPGPVWTGAKILEITGIRSPGRPVRSESLYRLRFPSPLESWNGGPDFLKICELLVYVISYHLFSVSFNWSDYIALNDGVISEHVVTFVTPFNLLFWYLLTRTENEHKKPESMRLLFGKIFEHTTSHIRISNSSLSTVMLE